MKTVVRERSILLSLKKECYGIISGEMVYEGFGHRHAASRFIEPLIIQNKNTLLCYG
jgi:hypothetical protein